MSRLGLYFHTIRHLRPVQIAARVWRRVYRPRPDRRAAPPRRIPVAPYATPILAVQTLIARDTFRFLNVERLCASAADWQPRDVARLWAYQLHYFADLNAQGAAAREGWQRPLLERWVSENPPGRGTGWEPYPLSLRMSNWVKWSAAGHVLPPSCHASLAVQARWLSHHLEYQILGNHLIANAKALLHAGLYFDGAEAQRWYDRGLGLIGQQLREQVLGDGGHFELSPMYHALVLEDLLDLINLLRAYGRVPVPAWYQTVGRMRRWLLLMSHPDGEIAFFNDAALGVAPTTAEIEAYAGRLGLAAEPEPTATLTVLADSGYVRVSRGSAYLICDCAPVGARYQPGHAHADTLSFELSLAGRRVFVNAGVSEYGAGPERQRQRGTAAHNTVVVDGQNSSETWGAFRVARRAQVRLHRAALQGVAIVEASHDGYQRLAGRNRHTRRWELDAHALRIKDQIGGEFEQAEARFHLHPNLQVRRDERGVIVLLRDSEEVAQVSFEGCARVELGRGTWHPRFGVSIDNSWIGARVAKSVLVSTIRWRAP